MNYNVFLSTATNDIMLLNFYAEWCRFSQMLKPVFDKAADMLQDDYPVSLSLSLSLSLTHTHTHTHKHTHAHTLSLCFSF